jgi:hypothetical protein
MKTLLVALGIVALVGCGSNDSGGVVAPKDASATASSVEGTWLYYPTTSEALRLSFSGNTWKMEMLALLTLRHGWHVHHPRSAARALSSRQRPGARPGYNRPP